jgi:hypothetical protein
MCIYEVSISAHSFAMQGTYNRQRGGARLQVQARKRKPSNACLGKGDERSMTWRPFNDGFCLIRDHKTRKQKAC